MNHAVTFMLHGSTQMLTEFESCLLHTGTTMAAAHDGRSSRVASASDRTTVSQNVYPSSYIVRDA